jgi:GT2 family glycosyltransferase
MALTFTPSTGVSIVHGTSLDDTVRLLRLLELSNDLDLEIVVAVRGGAADEPALVDRLQGRGSIQAVPPGASDAAAHNAVLARIVERGSQYAWVLRPELIIERPTLGQLIRQMKVRPDCAVVGARILQSGGPQPRIWSDGGAVSPDGSFKRHSAGLKLSTAPKAKPTDVDAVCRTGALYRVAALESVGLFGEGDEVDGHDVHWSDRARRAGWRVIVQRRAAPTLEGVHG